MLKVDEMTVGRRLNMGSFARFITVALVGAACAQLQASLESLAPGAPSGSNDEAPPLGASEAATAAAAEAANNAKYLKKVAFRKAKAEEHAAKKKAESGAPLLTAAVAPDEGAWYRAAVTSALAAEAMASARTSGVGGGSGAPVQRSSTSSSSHPAADSVRSSYGAALPGAGHGSIDWGSASAKEVVRLKRIEFRKHKQEAHARMRSNSDGGGAAKPPKTESVAECFLEFPELLSRADRELAPWAAHGISRAMLDNLWRCGDPDLTGDAPSASSHQPPQSSSPMRRFAGLYASLRNGSLGSEMAGPVHFRPVSMARLLTAISERFDLPDCDFVCVPGKEQL
jgi:hypothetical protein